MDRQTDQPKSKIRTQSRYSEIALWIARRIQDGQYQQGEKISARTSLASSFKASAETVRRALWMLADLGIVEAREKSGFYVLSKEQAELFVSRHENSETFHSLFEDLRESVRKQKEQLSHLEESLDRLEMLTERSRMDLALSPAELSISKDCLFLKQNLRDIRLWEYTGCTIVAIRKGGELVLSPGPLAILEENDVLYFVGSKQKLMDYLYAAPLTLSEPNAE